MPVLFIASILFFAPITPTGAITVTYHNLTHVLSVAPNGSGFDVYDQVDDGRFLQVSRARQASGPLVAVANNTLRACWSENSTIRQVVYCGYYDEKRGGWLYEFMGTGAGAVTSLYVVGPDKMALNMHVGDLDSDACPSGNIWTWIPEDCTGDSADSALPNRYWAQCGIFIPHRLYLPTIGSR